jgi:hypothetical protein
VVTTNGRYVIALPSSYVSVRVCVCMSFRPQLTVSEELTSSLCGGFLSTVVTIPIDVVVAQIQQASAAGKKVWWHHVVLRSCTRT